MTAVVPFPRLPAVHAVAPGVSNGATATAEHPHCRVLNPLLEPDWDRWLDSFPEATIFHTAAWAAALHDTYRFQPRYLTLNTSTPDDLGQPVAILPLMECSSRIAGRRGVSLPFTDHLPPLALNRTSLAVLIDQALAEGRRRNWRHWQCRGGIDRWPDPHAPRPSPPSPPSHSSPPSLPFYHHTLTLDRHLDTLHNRLASPVRRGIRRAEAAGVLIDQDNSIEGIRAYYQLHCLTRRDHGLPPQPFAFFRNLHRHLIATGAGRVFLARHHDRPVAGAVFLHRHPVVTYKFGGSDRQHQALRANNLLFWKAISFYANQGFATLDFGRTSTHHEGLRRFKLGWATVESTVHTLEYHFPTDRFVAGRDRTAGWHTHFFRRLPLWLSRRLGNLLYPHLT